MKRALSYLAMPALCFWWALVILAAVLIVLSALAYDHWRLIVGLPIAAVVMALYVRWIL